MQAPVALQLLSVPWNHHHLLIRSSLLLCAALAWPAESRQLETMTAAGLNNLTKPQKISMSHFLLSFADLSLCSVLWPIPVTTTEVDLAQSCSICYLPQPTRPHSCLAVQTCFGLMHHVRGAKSWSELVRSQLKNRQR